MVAEAANTSVSILRGTATDPYGDTVDSGTPYMFGVPAILTETGRSIQDPSTPMPRTIRSITCHVPPWTGVQDTDQIYDESTGDTYIILGVTRPPTLIGTPVDMLLTLKRVTAQGA